MDEIYLEFIKNIESFTLIVNIFILARLPLQFKKTNVIAILKKGYFLRKMSNYRLIFLFSVSGFWRRWFIGAFLLLLNTFNIFFSGCCIIFVVFNVYTSDLPYTKFHENLCMLRILPLLFNTKKLISLKNIFS